MEPILSLDIERWDGGIDAATQTRAAGALEDGKVICFPRLAFAVASKEASVLDPSVSDGKAKNVTWFPDRGKLQGTADGAGLTEIRSLLARYAATTRRFVETLLPTYGAALAWGPTTLRPVEISGRVPRSWRHDDTRLHTDAFRSRPTGGTRILRFFSNVDPMGTPRVWRVGGRFEDYATPLAPALRGMWPGQPAVLAALGITAGRRSLYDQLMLQLHDRMKLDDAYQRDGIAAEIAFPAASSWMVFTDQVPHAAIAGRNALEQTFQIPVAAQLHPERSPLKLLERLRGRPLVP